MTSSDAPTPSPDPTAAPTAPPTAPPTARSGERPLSALPSPLARAIAFGGVLLGGLAGAVIGYALVAIQCTGDCAVAKGLGLLAGAVVAALGMAVVAVLGLRAMGEWREVLDRERAGHAPG